jgi:hypothetical protein
MRSKFREKDSRGRIWEIQSNLVISDSYISKTLIYRPEPSDSIKLGEYIGKSRYKLAISERRYDIFGVFRYGQGGKIVVGPRI